MAKGDSGDYQKTINQQGSVAQTNLDQNRNSNIATGDLFRTQLNKSISTDEAMRNGIMGGYQGFMNGGINTGGASIDPALRGNVDESIAGYRGFSQNGGFQPGDIADIRARNIAPTRAIYSNAQNNINRQRALQGGYSPNFTAASAKMARELSGAIGDTNVNTNASLAQMIQQGKLSGLSGMAQSALGQESAGLQADQINTQAAIAGTNARLGGLSGMSSLYSATPGMSKMNSDAVLASQGLLNQNQGLQNQLSLGLINAQRGKSDIPGDFQAGMGNVSSAAGGAGALANALKGIGGNRSIFNDQGNFTGQTLPSTSEYNPNDYAGIDPMTGMPYQDPSSYEGGGSDGYDYIGNDQYTNPGDDYYDYYSG